MPDAAERQDMELLESIAEYRAAGRAMDSMNSPNKADGFRQLAAHPSLGAILLKMRRALDGLPLDGNRGGEETEITELVETYRNVGEEPVPREYAGLSEYDDDSR